MTGPELPASAGLYVLDGKRVARLVRVDAAELAELRRLAGSARRAYVAGFGDGRDRLAEELGVVLPLRIRSAEDRIAAESAALEENAVRAIYRAGREDGAAAALGPRGCDAPPRRHLQAVDSTPGGAS